MNDPNPYSPPPEKNSAEPDHGLNAEIRFEGSVTAEDVDRMMPRLWIGCLMQVLAALILVPMLGVFLSIPFLQSSRGPMDPSAFVSGLLMLGVLSVIILLASWLGSRRRRANRLLRWSPWMIGEVAGAFRTEGLVIRNQQTVDYQQLSWSSLKTVRVTEHGVCLSRLNRHDAFIALPASLFDSFDAPAIRQTLAELRRQCDAPPTVSAEDCRDQCPDDGVTFETLTMGTTDIPKTNPILTLLAVVGIVSMATGIPFSEIDELGFSWGRLTLAAVFLLVWAASWIYSRKHPVGDINVHLTGWVSPTECQIAMPGFNRKYLLADAIDVAVGDQTIHYDFPDDHRLVFDRSTFTTEQWSDLNEWATSIQEHRQDSREESASS